MKRFIIALALVPMLGCAKIHMACPNDSVEHAMIGGNNVGTVAITALMAAAGKAGLMAPKLGAAQAGAPVAPEDRTTVDYTYVPIFGTDYVMCGQGPLPH